ncbi:MAG: MBL fold metallo-hydrolase [Acidobacteria bacterium]|nr:MBL fold metallo-hydrolase [Acidobacteriota bacterium]
MVPALTAALALGLVLSLPAFAQQDWDAATIETVQVTDGIAMLVGPGGNVGVSTGADGVFLIDDEYGQVNTKVLGAIQKLSSDPIRFVINTHWHDDHTGGNKDLASTGSVIVAHEGVRRRMAAGQVIEAFGMNVPPAPPEALPVITFTDAVTFHRNGDDIHVFHVAPAHTDGDSVIRFEKANVIHTGDLYFNGFYPFIDTSSGGSIEGMIAGVDRILEIADDSTKIIPGHGPLSNPQELKAYRTMLETVRDRVAKLKAEGKSADEVVAAKPTADLDEVWGKGFLPPDIFVKLVYDGMK